MFPTAFSRHPVLSLGIFALGLTYALAAFAADADCQQDAHTLIYLNRHGAEGGMSGMAVNADMAIDSVIWRSQRGDMQVLPVTRRGGPPWSLEFSLETAEDGGGQGQLEVVSQGRRLSCQPLEVDAPAARHWSRPMEALFSAWVEKLFDAPVEEALAFPSLEPVLRDPERNALYGSLGRDEDRRLPATPDCADLPYYLRSYFAWKLGLPVAWRACSRGSLRQAPRCEASPHLEASFLAGSAGQEVFRRVSHGMMDMVHSGTARAPLQDDSSDLYPLPLSREALWPGTVYADPYGHVLMLVKWVPPAAGHPGILLAADAQPDHSVTRKRFWEGSFLFDTEGVAAGPGFKAFRPFLASNGGDGRYPAGNAVLQQHYLVAPYSGEQADLGREDFYLRMAQLINPEGLEPTMAYRAMHDALLEQLQNRVVSVDNGERYARSHPGTVIAMPAGAAVFQTLGAWEDFATPSRDMRLLIALSVMAQLPSQVTEHPELFRLGRLTPQEARQQLEALHQKTLAEAAVSYSRSDGSSQTLALGDIFARRQAFEVAYNPNDCVEIRWGAVPDTAEAATCRRRAPAEQMQRMEAYRSWFHAMKRPG